MPVLDLMRRRCSVRKFKNKPVPRDELMDVLEAARVAPSACNLQPWRFVVVDDAALKAKVASAWAAKAPAIVVACGDHGTSWHRGDGKDHCDVDIAIAVDHLTLAATEKGLGTCWVCSFDARAVAAALQLPEGLEPIVLVPIGYPAGELSPSDRHAAARKPLDEIVSFNGLGRQRA